ncbi:MAG: hypothetical protein JWN47_731, partial [Frankiales bacterium]|nr:hypothetical protein [Frankiales bacterium]
DRTESPRTTIRRLLCAVRWVLMTGRSPKLSWTGRTYRAYTAEPDRLRSMPVAGTLVNGRWTHRQRT